MSDFWTADRIEQLRVLHKEGLGAKNIAARLNCTKGMVVGKMHRLGIVLSLNGPEWPQELRDRLRDMHIAGTPYTEIARVCGATEFICRRKAAQMGLPPRPHNSFKRRPPSKNAPRGFTPRIVTGLEVPSTDLAASITDATGCLWAITPHDAGKGDHRFCNHPQEGKGPYCPYHAEMARAKPEPKASVKRFKIPVTTLRSVA